MLKELYIRNFTIIDTLSIDFDKGFSVVTGETGAGKSIILGAISLLMGQRADTKTIKENADKCIIEAHFDLKEYGLQNFFEKIDIEYDDEDCIIRREISSNGKSRSFINDTPVQQSILKELGGHLIDIHSQHQNLMLGNHDYQLQILDIIAGNSKLIDKLNELYKNYLTKRDSLVSLKLENEQLRQKADYLNYQHDELSSANLADGEQQELEQRREFMCHAEEIKENLYNVDMLFSNERSGIIDNVRQTISLTGKLSGILPEINDINKRLQENLVELKDISYEVCCMLDNTDFDANEMEHINERLDTIYRLQKKYNCNTTEELIAYSREIEQQLDKIENYDDDYIELEKQVEELKKQCETIAKQLTETRQKVSIIIEKEIIGKLVKLGMPNVTFKCEIEDTHLSQNGCDKVTFLFSANNNKPQPISQIASGGEISRVMLALKDMISSYQKLPTIIFDEIDTGVSGRIAENMALMMKEMSQNGRQVLAITHLPQIAASGNKHYKVYKEINNNNNTISNMKMLNNEERIKEIAQMLSGCDITKAAIENAKELLKI